MNHIDVLNGANGVEDRTEFLQRASGRFYTHEVVGRHLARAIWSQVRLDRQAEIRVIDPFAGDGRLLEWLLEAAIDSGNAPHRWSVDLWDIDTRDCEASRARLRALARGSGLRIRTRVVQGDTFTSPNTLPQYDIVVTNPPWELLKPDSRELSRLDKAAATSYVRALREYDEILQHAFPEAQPKRRFAGWGTNLSRVGIQASFQLVNDGGIGGLVVPASFLADDNSEGLRRLLLNRGVLLDAAYFPAEARLFGRADVEAATVVVRKSPGATVHDTQMTRYDGSSVPVSQRRVRLDLARLAKSQWTIPARLHPRTLELFDQLGSFPTFSELESGGLWAGRELDETRIAESLDDTEGHGLFVKGRMVDRFSMAEQPSQWVALGDWQPPQSVQFERIAWRDVSRPNQRRRVIASLIPRGWIAGNSLGVAYFDPPDPASLRILLALMNSFPFEFQLRTLLATGHISVTSLRRARLPLLSTVKHRELLLDAVERALAGDADAEILVEAIAARAYGLQFDDLAILLEQFPKVPFSMKRATLLTFAELGVSSNGGSPPTLSSAEIPNHYSATLSDLDIQMARHIPPGGNWKDIPETIPSQRVSQIRTAFADGRGSRSTYYGRLRPEEPSYTISTNFHRPGNGCHLHYEPTQDRVISQREAARLQSFPDDFRFSGSKASVNKQIGNAVPPLLAYQIAISLGGTRAVYADTFCGAGGLGLGFKWAGWEPLLGTDIDPSFLHTYQANVHPLGVRGDLGSDQVFEAVRADLSEQRRAHSNTPLWVLGGPPCQGFSTAGNRRTMDDPRNHLVWTYRRLLDAVHPDGFLFENVTGLRNMKGGEIFEQVLEVLGEGFDYVESWVLHAADYAIPQRRSRVFILATNEPEYTLAGPRKLTPAVRNVIGGQSTFSDDTPPVSVVDALSDLPPLVQGQDGSHLQYSSGPSSPYQRLMRGAMTPAEYVSLYPTSA